ncbi:MAG: hypothetical protein SFV24_18385 [Gemmatimonadales bacterium]|nr:hypothetical protein [Gemmatimonadales bacterium]
MTRRRNAVSDEAVMAAVTEALAREGPGVTLATMARHARLSAPRLIQRHGGRDQLILAAFKWSAARQFEALRRTVAADRPLEALLATLGLGEREVSARDLRVGAQWIVFEWASPTMRRFHRAYQTRLRSSLAGVLRAAVRSGEIPPHDSALVAERLLVHLFGMAMYYSFMNDVAGYRREMRRILDWLISSPTAAARGRVSRRRRAE